MPDKQRPYRVVDLPDALKDAQIAVLRATVLATFEGVPAFVADALSEAAVLIIEVAKACPDRSALEVAEFQANEQGTASLRQCARPGSSDGILTCTAPVDADGVCADCGQCAIPF